MSQVRIKALSTNASALAEDWTGKDITATSLSGSKRALDIHVGNATPILVSDATVATSLATLLAAVDQLEGYTDGLETVLGTMNTTLTAISGFVDQLEGYTDGIEALLTALNGYVDQLEGFVDGIETSLTTISTNTTLTTRQKVLNANDLASAYTWASFGTKDERITRIDHTAASITPSTVRQDFVYTLTAGKYRLDSVTWSIV